MSNKDAIRAIRTIVGSHVVAFHTIHAEITGALSCGIMLSQFCFWAEHAPPESDGWFHKTQAEIQDRTCLTRHEQDYARKKLIALGLIEIRKEGLPLKVFFRLNFERLTELILGLHSSMPNSGILEESNTYGNGNSALNSGPHSSMPNSGILEESNTYRNESPAKPDSSRMPNSGNPHNKDLSSLLKQENENQNPTPLSVSKTGKNEGTFPSVETLSLAQKISTALREKNVNGTPDASDPTLLAHLDAGLSYDEIMASAAWCLKNEKNSFGYVMTRARNRREDAAKLAPLPKQAAPISKKASIPLHPSHIADTPNRERKPRAAISEDLVKKWKALLTAPLSFS